MDFISSVQQMFNQIFQNILNDVFGASALTNLMSGKRNLGFNSQDALAFFNQYQTYFQGSISNLFTTVQGILQNYQSLAAQFLTNLSTPQARTQFIVAADRMKGDLDAALRNWLDDAWNWIQTQTAQGINVVLATGLNIYNLFGKRGFLDGITDTLSGHINNITDAIISLGGSLWQQVQPTLQDLQDQLTNHALNAAQSLLGTLANISGSLSG